MNNHDNYSILDTYSLMEFYRLNHNKLREIYKYVPDDYGIPTLKRFLYFGNKQVGFGASCIDTPLQQIISYPEDYQIIKIGYKGKSHFFRICTALGYNDLDDLGF